MRKGLLIILFNILIIGIGYSQLAIASSDCDGCPAKTLVKKDNDLQIFPNPATHYIELNTTKKVDRIVIYNVVGRRMKSFKVEADGEKYYINSLPIGMYLVQLVNASNKVITTQRLSKR